MSLERDTRQRTVFSSFTKDTDNILCFLILWNFLNDPRLNDWRWDWRGLNAARWRSRGCTGTWRWVTAAAGRDASECWSERPHCLVCTLQQNQHISVKPADTNGKTLFHGTTDFWFWEHFDFFVYEKVKIKLGMVLHLKRQIIGNNQVIELHK